MATIHAPAHALLPSSITRQAFLRVLHDYPRILNAESSALADGTKKAPRSGKASGATDLTTLEEQRYQTIPATLVARRAADEKSGKKEGRVHVTRAELTTLMRWKLTHGTPRPTLLALIAQNSEEHVVDATQRGLQGWVGIDEEEDEPIATEDLKRRMHALCELRGVGPATASLLLSVARPRAAPFFSDELFRWCCLSDPDDRDPGLWRFRDKIRYSQPEYRQMLDKVRELILRLAAEREEKDEGGDIGAVECEKVAYVLGHAWDEYVSADHEEAGTSKEAAKSPAPANKTDEAGRTTKVERESRGEETELQDDKKPKRVRKRQASQKIEPEEVKSRPIRNLRSRRN